MEFAVLVYSCIYKPDDDLVLVETCSRNVTRYYLLLSVKFRRSNTM